MSHYHGNLLTNTDDRLSEEWKERSSLKPSHSWSQLVKSLNSGLVTLYTKLESCFSGNCSTSWKPSKQKTSEGKMVAHHLMPSYRQYSVILCCVTFVTLVNISDEIVQWCNCPPDHTRASIKWDLLTFTKITTHSPPYKVRGCVDQNWYHNCSPNLTFDWWHH